MIRFNCPSCKRGLSAPDDKAGMRFACPGCKSPVEVPLASAVQAGPFHSEAGTVSGEAKPFGKRVWNETVAIGLNTFRCNMKPVTYFFELFRRSRLRKKVKERQFTLGQRMYEAKVGDAKTRSRIQQLGERIQSIQDVKGDARAAISERRSLIFQLAEPLMNSKAAPEAIETEHQEARVLKSKLAAQEEALAGALGGLMPPNRTAWRRMVIGNSLIVLLALGIGFKYMQGVWAQQRQDELLAQQKAADEKIEEENKLWETKKDMEAVVEKCGPSVATIQCGKDGKEGGGTGFMIRPGVIATNAHVVDGHFAEDIQVVFPSAKGLETTKFVGQILYFDRKRDLAFMSVDAPLPPLRMPENYEFKSGSEIFVIGSPGFGGSKDGQLKNVPSRGNLGTQTEVDSMPYFQMSIAVNPGNSGGPVFDSRGQVIGVVTLKATRQEQISFCIPWKDLKDRLDALEKEDPNKSALIARSPHTYHALGMRLIRSTFTYLRGMSGYSVDWQRNGVNSAKSKLDAFLEKYKDNLVQPKHVAMANALQSDPNITQEMRNTLSSMIRAHDELKAYATAPANNLSTHRNRMQQLQNQLQTPLENMLKAFGFERPKDDDDDF